jgi:hypothetical protein
MRKRNNLEMICAFPIHEKERKVSQRYAANGAACTDATNDLSNGRLAGDQIYRCLDLRPQAISKADALVLIPLNVVTKLFFRLGVRAY